MQSLAASSTWEKLGKNMRAHELRYIQRGGGLSVASEAPRTILCKSSEVGPGYADLIKKLRQPFPGHSVRWIAERVLKHGRVYPPTWPTEARKIEAEKQKSGS